MKYAIIDIETTGDKPVNFKIIEIAIIIHDGNKELDRYHTFVDPQQRISPFISRLTGIQDSDVQGAPKFFEIAKQIVEITKDTIFVAHNVSFDYGVIRREFKRLGFDYRLNHMCTVQSARILIPGHNSYSLKKICTDLGISLGRHHRAIDDTLATVELFKILFSNSKEDLSNFIKKEINPKILNPKFNVEEFDEIPNKTGVYKFFDDNNELIYIGKSIHIKKRVEQHLKNTKTNKAIEMRDRIASVKHELTGSELIALLKESAEIKNHQPVYNRAQKTNVFSHGLYLHEDQQGYINLSIKKVNLTERPLLTFTSTAKGKQYLEGWLDEFGLCQKFCNLHQSNSSCFNYSIKKCEGACVGEETIDDYNEKVNALIRQINFNSDSFLILDKGRNSKEFSFVWMDEGRYMGYGFILRYLLKRNVNNFRKHVIPHKTNRDFQSIIKMQLDKNPKLKVQHLGNE